MNKFRTQRYNAAMTVPAGANLINHTPTKAVNGILRGIVVVPPASFTGTSYGVKILDYNGATMFSKATLAAGSTSPIFTDANNNYIGIPIANNADAALIRLDIAGDTTPTGTLTGTNAANATEGKIVTIGDKVYKLTATVLLAYDVLIDSTADGTLTNLKNAVNAGTGAGTKYGTGTVANPYVSAGNVTSHAITFTALIDSAAENALVTTTNEPTYSWGDTTLADGGEAVSAAFTVDLYIERG